MSGVRVSVRVGMSTKDSTTVHARRRVRELNAIEGYLATVCLVRRLRGFDKRWR